MTQFPSTGEPQAPAEEGWTPSDDSSRQDEAPAGASFGAGLTAGASAGDGDDSNSRERPRRRRRSSKKKDTDETGSVAVAEEPANEDGSDDGGEEAPKRRRRRGSRGGRRRKKKNAEASEDEASENDAEPEAASDEEKPKKKRSRRGRRSKKSKEPQEAEAEAEEGEGDDDEDAAPRKRRRGSRGGRKRKKKKKKDTAVGIEAIPGEEDELSELSALADDEEASEKPAKKSRRKRGKKAKKTEDDDAPVAEEEEVRDQVILVNASDPEEARVAVVQDAKIVDLWMTVHSHRSYVNDIYRGRVVNLESAIGAAFVDFGQGRNGFLHASDVMDAYGESDWDLDRLLTHRLSDDELGEEGERLDIADDEGESDDEGGETKKKGAKRKKRKKRVSRRRTRQRRPINELLRKGAPAVIQVTKDAIGDKGPTLTTYISIPGRYLVLMPSLSRTGVSRKIDDEKERRRLKRILQSLDIPEGMGVIVRTAGIGKTKNDLRRDLEYLLIAWEDLSKRLTVGRSPIPLYQESDVAIRTMRDLFSSRTEAVIVDDEAVYDRMVEFTKALMPEHVDRVKLHDGARPLFHTHGVEQDFEKTFSRRVELPSGGSIVIDQTEALVAIDVNSGRTRDEGADFEDIALKTNLEAVPEIARQMRLRDLGGIIVLDFIDMARMGSRRQVEKALREALSTDRARSKIGRISQFGLLELTRQRLGPGMQSLLYDNCTRCRGTGRQRTAESRAQAILRRLGSALTLKGFSTVEVCAHPEVIEYLQRNCSTQIRNLREQSGRELRFKSVPDQVEDSVLHYLRADGREVRPGGRRKR